MSSRSSSEAVRGGKLRDEKKIKISVDTGEGREREKESSSSQSNEKREAPSLSLVRSKVQADDGTGKIGGESQLLARINTVSKLV